MGEPSIIMHSEESETLMLDYGAYAIFEGLDGVGKTTVMKNVAEVLPSKLGVDEFPAQLTHHPGATPLGAHLRKLTKYPEQIDPDITMDELSRQLLFMVDTVSFVNTVLTPALNNGQSIFADRSSFISAIVYGTASGLDLAQVNQMFQLIRPPKADRLYILNCPWEVARSRMGKMTDKELDYYERKSHDFYNKVESIYNDLITGPPERAVMVNHSVALDNVIYVDATLPLNAVVNIIADDLAEVIKSKTAVLSK
jgi:dTMP kinase